MMISARIGRTAFYPSARGFSLIELLIVLAVLAILTSSAYPSYMAYKVRANRGAVQAVMLDMANRQQMYFLDARSYATTTASLGHATLPAEVSSYYTIAVTAASGPPPTYSITATPAAGTMQANDGNLVVNGDGTKAGKW